MVEKQLQKKRVNHLFSKAGEGITKERDPNCFAQEGFGARNDIHLAATLKHIKSSE